MDFIDWCTRILNVLVEASTKSPHARTSGLDDVRLFRALFDETTPWSSQEHSSMNAALRSLEGLGLVEDARNHHPKVTRLGRELASDSTPFWQEICSINLQSDLQHILSTVNRLSHKTEDRYVWLEDVHHTTLLPELGETSPSELGSGGVMDTLWAKSVDLAELGLIERDARIGGHLILTATYQGLVWETRRRLFQKCDVFISHITEEKGIADSIKSLLTEVFGEDFKVFVSSDYRSIGGGKVWYSEIIESLTAAPVVLVLLSETSVERRWINFEAGVGIGAGSLVIPLVQEGFSKSKVGLPLSQLQVRALNDSKDVDGVLADIAERTKREASSVDTETFSKVASASDMSKLHAIINHVPDGAQEHRIIIGLVNDSPATLTDYRIELEVPNAFLNQSTGRSAEVESRRTNDHRFFRMMSKDSSVGHLYPGDRAPRFYSVNILNSAAVGDSANQKIRLSVFSGEVLTQKLEISLKEILETPPSFG
jgi:hypothetical protein